MNERPDLISQLASIRNRQGLDPLPDPRVIPGFGPNDPAPPSFPPTGPARQDEYIEEPEEEPSPLVQAAVRRPSAPGVDVEIPVQQAPQGPPIKLLVVDSSAAYMGQSVELNQQEQGQVIAVILRSLQRWINDSLAATQVVKPEPQVPRKRGRPRKS